MFTKMFWNAFEGGGRAIVLEIIWEIHCAFLNSFFLFALTQRIWWADVQDWKIIFICTGPSTRWPRDKSNERGQTSNNSIRGEKVEEKNNEPTQQSNEVSAACSSGSTIQVYTLSRLRRQRSHFSGFNLHSFDARFPFIATEHLS